MTAGDVGSVFDAAAAGFAEWSPLLWDRVGTASAAAAVVRQGERVLDACCGAGAATLPAGRAVGPSGHVDAVDLSAALLDIGRRRARAEGLDAVSFHHADLMAWAGDPYDAVLCVFGVFFLPDMDAAGARLVGLLRPGGRLVVTTWERGSVEPVVGPFAEAAAAVHVAAGGVASTPSAAVRANVARVDGADRLTGWLAGLGLEEPGATVERFDVPLTDDLAWSFVAGSGARAMLFGLGPGEVERVRTRFLATLRERGVDTLRVAAVVGRGYRPQR
jgi:ubiquinone/menaquinone biosynthesis C-methylase UbiE